MNWREYHEATKHTAEKLRRAGHVLDWANMPDPFRHYEGAPVLDLPADPPAPGSGPVEGAALLSQLLYYSAAISATKVVPHSGHRYALRVNPSSGNLHPTEFHFRTKGLKGWPDGLYHYRPSSHMAEQRSEGAMEIAGCESDAPVVFVLTSIAWREAWKYRERAYRYCLLDMGHAWEALAQSAQAAGWTNRARGHFADGGVAESLRLADDEWPMLVVELCGMPEEAALPRETQWHAGSANRLSTEVVPYARIDAIHAATACSGEPGTMWTTEAAREGRGEVSLGEAFMSQRPFAEVARTRRSALDFVGGEERMSMAQLSALLGAAALPMPADFGGARLVQLYVYAHRVEGLATGVYRHWAEKGELELVKGGDQRVTAAGLSLGQDLAGNACVAFSMVADLERATRAHGDRGYRYAHFEAGAIGQRLYIAAESCGLRGTGIGAFFDDSVHRYLDIAEEEGQVVYHFAVGYPVRDARLEG
jgi:SagB-type dehydrogenase family enzyme